MKTVYLFRKYLGNQTEGILIADSFTCKTLEREWVNNEKKNFVYS